MLVRKVINPLLLQKQLRLFAQRNPALIYGLRHKWVSGREARESNNVPVGTKVSSMIV